MRRTGDLFPGVVVGTGGTRPAAALYRPSDGKLANLVDFAAGNDVYAIDLDEATGQIAVGTRAGWLERFSIHQVHGPESVSMTARLFQGSPVLSVCLTGGGHVVAADRRVTTGHTSKFRMGCGTLFVTVNRDQHGLCEVFANLGRAGGCPSQSEATCRAVSVALRSGVDPEELIGQLRGIRCHSAFRAGSRRGDVNVLSCPDAIARAIEESLGDSCEPEVGSKSKLCPDCGHPLHRESGCFACRQCGYSNCG